MQKFFDEIFNWAEVWALFIPLTMWFTKRKQPVHFYPVIIYLFIALLFNFFADLTWRAPYLGIKLPFDNNNPIYNFHSIIRVLLFSWFFIKLEQPFIPFIKKIIPFIFLIFVFVNFLFSEYFFARVLSSRLLTLESGLLLFYCLQYYLYLVKVEQTEFMKLPSFWLVTGLCIFVMADLPIYFFYKSLINHDINFAIDIWAVPKISYVIFCIFTAKAFYVPNQ